MAKCLRCGAGAEWIKGRVKTEPPSDDATAMRLAALESAVREMHAADEAYGCGFYSDERWLAAYRRTHSLVTSDSASVVQK